MNILCKNDKLFFETLDKAYGRPDLGIKGDPVSQDKIRVALQAFLAEPKRIVGKKLQALKEGKIQAVGVSTDWTRLTADAFNVTVQSNNFDLKYENAFKQVSLGKGQDFWEIYDVANSLTFRKVEEGQRIEVAGMSGTTALVYVDYYGGALGWTDRMIRYRKVAAMVDIAETFRNQFYTNKANNHYALFAAAIVATGFITAWQAGTGQLQRDIRTMNTAVNTLANRCLNKGYGDMASAPMVLFANPADESRIEAIFRAKTSDIGAAGAAGEEVTKLRPIIRYYTYNTNVTAGSPILILPGNKIQKADDMAPTTYTAPQDILTLNYVQSVWAIYGAAVGDTDQIQQLTLG